jgi:hypothetical protein
MLVCLFLCASITFILNRTVFLLMASSIALSLGVFFKRLKAHDLEINEVNNNQNENLNEKVLKVSSVIDESTSEVLNYLNNYNSYKEWNKYLIGITDIKKDNPGNVTYRFCKNFMNEGEVELKVRRKKVHNTLIDFIEADNIMRVITVESNKNSTKLSIYLPLKNLSQNKIPITLIKSTFTCLDMLNLYITNRNFNKDITVADTNSEQERFSISSIETRKKSKAIYRKSNANDLRISNISEIQPIPEEQVKAEISNPFEQPSEPKPFDPNEQENEAVRKLYEIKIKEFDEYFNRPWKVMEEKNGYKIFYFDEVTGLRSIRSEITINKNYKEVYEYIQLFEKRSLYDKNWDRGHTIRIIDDHLSINYLKYKGKLMISPRDFYILTYKNLTEDEASLFATSYYDDVKYPKNKGVERADLKYGYFHFKKLDETRTVFTYYSLVIFYNID